LCALGRSPGFLGDTVMTRTSLDDAQWVSLMLVMQQIPLA
jgi:hypothetical protein